MQKIKVNVHKRNRLRKGRGRVKTSPSARLVNDRDAESSQPHLLSQIFYCKHIERTMEEQVREKVVHFGKEKSKWPWPPRPWRQASVSEVLQVSAVSASSARQGTGGVLPKCQIPVLSRAGFTRGSDRQIHESDFLCMHRKRHLLLCSSSRSS